MAPGRRRALVGGTVAIVAVALVAWFLSTDGRPSADDTDRVALRSGRSIFDTERAVRFSRLPAYRGVAYADALKSEQDRFASSLVADDVTGWHSPDFDGRYTHVVDGERRTTSPTPCTTCRPVTAWLFGGSAAFGLGQRDGHTIASELVATASRQGVALTVRNFGVPGWTRVQEVSALEQRLRTEARPPDLVVFYDGFNDVVGATLSAATRGLHPDQPSMMDNDDILAFTRRYPDPRAVASPARLAAVVDHRLTTQRDRVAALIDPTTTRVVEFFQPDAFASTAQLAAVRGRYPRVGDDLVAYFTDALAETARLSAGDEHDLRAAFDTTSDPVFADFVHTNESGATRIAAAMWPTLSGDEP